MLTPATRLPTSKVSSDKVASVLSRFGFLRTVAGDEDFSSAVDAVVQMYAKGRGIFMTGPAGCGKTHLMRTIMRAMGNTAGESFYYCKEPQDIAALRSPDDLMNTNIYLDDIGAEEIIREYGNTIDAVGDFVQRYHYRGTGRFFATTNLDSSQVNARYGGRVLDRILEMCVVLKFSGKSKRERVIV